MKIKAFDNECLCMLLLCQDRMCRVEFGSAGLNMGIKLRALYYREETKKEGNSNEEGCLGGRGELKCFVEQLQKGNTFLLGIG